ncbi:hypothetical protein DJ017_04420 [Phenylobacterium soli]|uniref:Cytochrome c domain-containing protein n=1 Tax=Phenylobacterium soli TaxID=2170551 RepID=A0A328AH41_9CAUL|nr:hypothetical protein DJ017_04420 [Phenylobacterium soli]
MLACLSAAVLMAACSQPKPAAKAEAGAAKFNTSLPMDEFMGHVVDPASFQYWEGSGTEVTAKGEKDLSPTTEEGWTKLENAAATLIEAGNAMQLPGRARAPEADWYRHSQVLIERAVAAKAAAEKHDKEAVFKAGAALYEECTACHEQYVIQPELKANGPAKGDPLPPLPADIQAKVAAKAAGK